MKSVGSREQNRDGWSTVNGTIFFFGIKPLGLRIEPVLNESNINVKNIKPFKLPVNEPWTIDPPHIIFYLNINKKSVTNPLFYQNNFLEIKSQYKDYFSIYTDGSKQDNKVGCASVHKQETARIRLPDHSSIFSSPEHEVLMVSYCDHAVSVVRRVVCVVRRQLFTLCTL